MRPFLLATLVCGIAVPNQAQAQQPKRPLDHDAYDGWSSIEDERLSDDGRWILYALAPQEGDAVLHVKSITSETAYTVARGRDARFTDNAGFVIFLIKPELAEVRKAQQEKKKPEEQPKDSLGILDLATGDETGYEHVTEYAFSEEGVYLAYLASSKDGAADGAFLVRLPDVGSVRAMLTGEGVYKTLTFAEDGERLAFLSNTEDYEAEQPAFSLYYWEVNEAELRTVARVGTPGIPDGWWVSEHGDLEFSQSGRRLFFGTPHRSVCRRRGGRARG